jgi:hypothetical protein
MCVPVLAQAARAMCRLARGAATQRWCFLANNFRGGLFCHFIDAGGLMCQKFDILFALAEFFAADFIGTFVACEFE